MDATLWWTGDELPPGKEARGSPAAAALPTTATRSPRPLLYLPRVWASRGAGEDGDGRGLGEMKGEGGHRSTGGDE
jgi:hypothetical protein